MRSSAEWTSPAATSGGSSPVDWEEAVGDGAERLAQPVAVGEADACERGGQRARLGLGHPLLDRPPQRRVERRARAACAPSTHSRS